MTIQVSAATLVALLLASARAAGFIYLAPPFNSRTIPGSARAALGLALSLILYPHILADIPAQAAITTSYLVATTITEVFIGAALGFVVQLLFAAVQTAGSLIDTAGGFTLQPAMDPLSLNSSGPLGKFYYLLATTMLFTSGAHLLLIRGLVSSYNALPLGAHMDTGHLAEVLITAMGMMFLAAMQIAAPLVAVLLLADVALGVLSRAAPAMNVITMTFPVKILITLFLVGLAWPLLPSAVHSLINHALRAMASLMVG